VAGDYAVAPNARMVTRVEYGIDPRGWTMVHRLQEFYQRTNAGRTGTRVGPRHARFNGVAPSPQTFTGLAGPGLGRARTVTPPVTRLDNAPSATASGNDSALAVFAAQARRQR
jgi:hypothetical protein